MPRRLRRALLFGAEVIEHVYWLYITPLAPEDLFCASRPAGVVVEMRSALIHFNLAVTGLTSARVGDREVRARARLYRLRRGEGACLWLIQA